MADLCRWTTIHCLRFDAVETPETLMLAGGPAGAASWQIGPDGPVGPDGNRLPSNIWCAVALYRERGDAERALDDPAAYLPFLARATEHWHALLLPITHRGTCNHVDAGNPGPVIEPAAEDPGGPLVVLTTAGYEIGPGFDYARVVDFRRNVDHVRAEMPAMDGNVARQVFTPYVFGSDGYTISVWRDDQAAAAFAYKPGRHRTQLDRYKVEQTADRTSFSRFRPLRSVGQWEGRCPVAAALDLRAARPAPGA